MSIRDRLSTRLSRLSAASAVVGTGLVVSVPARAALPAEVQALLDMADVADLKTFFVAIAGLAVTVTLIFAGVRWVRGALGLLRS